MVGESWGPSWGTAALCGALPLDVWWARLDLPGPSQMALLTVPFVCGQPAACRGASILSPGVSLCSALTVGRSRHPSVADPALGGARMGAVEAQQVWAVLEASVTNQ